MGSAVTVLALSLPAQTPVCDALATCLFAVATIGYLRFARQATESNDILLLRHLCLAMGLGGVGQALTWFSPLAPAETLLAFVSAVTVAAGLLAGIDQSQMTLEAEAKRRTQQTSELTSTNESLEAFVHSASHDLKAPLRHISSFVNFVQNDAKDRLTDSEKKDLDRVAQASNHMTELLNSLLMFARLGTRSLNRETFELQEIVDSIVSQLPQDQKEKVKAGELSKVTADRNLLTLVLQNLIENGLKYVRGEATVLIQSETTKTETQVWVIDNGIGIEPHQLTRIFRPGVRGVADAEFAGTGYGLASCVRIVEAHQGQIGVESEVGHGATFHFTLPIEIQPVRR